MTLKLIFNVICSKVKYLLLGCGFLTSLILIFFAETVVEDYNCALLCISVEFHVFMFCFSFSTSCKVSQICTFFFLLAIVLSSQMFCLYLFICYFITKLLGHKHH